MPALAKENTTGQTGASSSSPSADHLRLSVLAGYWQGDERMAASAWTAEGEARADVVAECLFSGFFVEQRYRQIRNGAVSFEARNVLGYDPSDQSYKLYQFDSVGFVPQAPATGHWEGETLVLVKTSPRGRQRIAYNFENEDRYRMSVHFAASGSDDWQDVVSGVYRRVASFSSNQT